MRHNIFKISSKKILYALLLVPFFTVQSISMLGATNQSWNVVYNFLAVFRIIISGMTFFYFVIQRYRTNLLSKGIIIYELIVLFATKGNGNLTFQFSLTMCMATAGFALLCQILEQKDSSTFLNACVWLFGILSFLGVVSILLFPNGFNYASQKKYAIYFLGSKNSSYYYYACYLFLKTYSCLKNTKLIKAKIIYYNLIFILTTIICDSSNGTLMLLAILLGLLVIKYRSNLRKFLKPSSVIFLVTILAILIPYVSRGMFDPLFKLIGRSSDFSMRIYIWQSAIDYIKKSPIVGNGKDGDLVFYGRQLQAHNFYLDIGAKFGMIALCVCIGLIIAVAFKMRNCKNKELIYTGSLFLLATLVHSLFDNTSMYYMILMLAFVQRIGNERIAYPNKKALCGNSSKLCGEKYGVYV